MLSCVPSAVAWACHPLWQRCHFPGFLIQQPQSVGCGDARWQCRHLQCAESRQQIMCHQQQVRTVCVDSAARTSHTEVRVTGTTHVIVLYFFVCVCVCVCVFVCVCVCSECPNKHLGPVWQLRWTQQELSLSGEENVEALFSVAADGRICKWFVCNNGLDCIGTVLSNGWWFYHFHFRLTCRMIKTLKSMHTFRSNQNCNVTHSQSLLKEKRLSNSSFRSPLNS